MRRAPLAGVLRKLGREGEAVKQIKIARRLMTGETKYNRACLEAICGNTQVALTLLEVVLQRTPNLRGWARLDPDFDFIRGDPRFKALVEEPSTNSGGNE